MNHVDLVGLMLAMVLASCALARATEADEVAAALTPEPQTLALTGGTLSLRGRTVPLRVPAGPEHEACTLVLGEALRLAGATPRTERPSGGKGSAFSLGEVVAAPSLPAHGPEAYSLCVGPGGASATANSAAGLLHAAQTFRQLARLSAAQGQVPCLTIVDYPAFPVRGLYIEGGQERFGRIVDGDYLIEQIHRLSEFKLNTLVIECYNLFPLASFPACADAGTLSPAECRALVAEARRYHVTLVPSLQTLAQAWELVWASEAGKPYRETTAPGMMCPSNPELYPFIQGLYRDLLALFGDSPYIGIGCSEIDMQWQSRFCPRCQARVQAGATTRELLLGHAEKCIQVVRELATESGRPVRPLMWGDEFYMYGPGRDWVGLERIPKDTVMGYWKYWPDYAGIGGLLQRGYDVVGVSALYNHCFYLADLSPETPKKLWAPMAQTGVRNITEMMQEAQRVTGAGSPPGRFLGAATASFSKHRLRACDSLWYGFALNGHCAWSHPERPLGDYQPAFTRAFAHHYYDCRTAAAAATVAAAYERLDRGKSQLELANQTLHDVIGVYDTQEGGYAGNTLAEALSRCAGLIKPSAEPTEELARLRRAAMTTTKEAQAIQASLVACQSQVGRPAELADLWLAGEKIAAHAERQVLMVDTQAALRRAEARGEGAGREMADTLAALAQRWQAHRARMARVLRRTRPLYRTGDPCGLASLLTDIGAVEAHLRRLLSDQQAPGEVLLEEPFQALDPGRWIVRAQPEVAAGHLQTLAPGGWEHYCGLTTRQSLPLQSSRLLVVEFVVTPVRPGLSSPLFGSGSEQGDLAYRFCCFGRDQRFGVYTQLTPPGGATAGEPGWQPRGQSPRFEVGTDYHLRAEITRRSFRVVVSEAQASRWRLPFWDSGALTMDDLGEARLLFSDVEPPDSTATSRWGPIRVTLGADQVTAP